MTSGRWPTRRAAREPGGEDDVGQDDLTAVAFLRVSYGAETPSTGSQDRGGDAGDRQSAQAGKWPRYQQGRDEYGEVHSAGMPPEAHGIEGLVDLDEDIGAMRRIAGLLLERGASPAAGDWLYGWASV